MCALKRGREDTRESRAALLLWVLQRGHQRAHPRSLKQRVLTSVFLMLPTLTAVAVRLSAGHALALRISTRVTA
jgi:hypothetical protein